MISHLPPQWPTYRADAGRSGYTPDALPALLELRWVERGTRPLAAWPSSGRVTFDFAHQPILVGENVIFGSTADDSVRALDVKNGRLRWQYFTGGPVRFAPAAWHDRVFVASDDGYLYALSLSDGALLWKHRGGPSARLCLGNERVISRWPARGGPVVWGSAVYYCAGIWPSGGIYVYALDAATGNVVWSNRAAGEVYMPQPHGGAEANSGVTPQGYLVANEQRIFVPTGRAVPASFRRDEGTWEYYLLQENGSIGGARALLADRFVVNGGCFLEQSNGKLAARAGRGVFSSTADGLLQFTGSGLYAYRWASVSTRDRKGAPAEYRGLSKFAELKLAEPADEVRRAAEAAKSLPALDALFRTDIVFQEADDHVARQTGLERVLAQTRPDVQRLGADVAPFQAAAYERYCEVIAAGQEAVCGTRGKVFVVDLRGERVRWSYEVEGDAVGLAAADGVLLVATTEGLIYCFADPNTAPRDTETAVASDVTSALPVADEKTAERAEEILRKSGIQDGFCLDIGCGDGTLALELARRSRLTVIGLSPDAQQVDQARRMLAQAGVYGSRVAIVQSPLDQSVVPRYFADLIVSSGQLENPAESPDPRLISHALRPCGGVSCLGAEGELVTYQRGPLEGAGLWTHQNSDAANTLCSNDMLVRGPLEVAWYRDGVIEIPDRHAQGPAPLYNRGMLVVEGVHGVCGLDAYNGRTRWIYPIQDLLSDWDGVHHDVGVGDMGSNFCLGDDAVFVRTGARCLKIDLQTGRQISEFRTPVAEEKPNREWGYIACAGGILYGSVLNDEHKVSPRYADIRLRTESVLFFAMDANTGEVLWEYSPQHSIRNNAIAIAGDRVFLIDRPLAIQDRITQPQPNGKHRPVLKPGEYTGGTLLGIDAHDGHIVWRNDEQIWGTQLAVSSRAGVLLMYYQGVKHDFFRLPSETGGRMAAFATDSGTPLWNRVAEYKTRPIINGDVIYAEGGAWSLETGEEVPWKFRRSYGCGQIAASRYLMVFRSATLGYWDLSRDVGVENFGGVRTGCWFNAIPAGGLVLVPDASAKCACSYQMHAWLALQPSAQE